MENKWKSNSNEKNECKISFGYLEIIIKTNWKMFDEEEFNEWSFCSGKKLFQNCDGA